MKNKIFLLTLFVFFGLHLSAQNVTIPDNNLKAALVNNASINTNGDAEIQVAEAIAYADSISVPSLGITNLTGLEAFVNIIYLDCSSNPFGTSNTTLNFSANSKLETLSINGGIDTLILTSNFLLKYLNCSNNGLQALLLPNPSNLITIDCQFTNHLTQLDVSGCANLKHLLCWENNLTSLDLSNNPLLDSLDCGRNALTSLILPSGSSSLRYLRCSNNQLTILDVSLALALNYLNCESNQLAQLDVSNNTDLRELNCGRNSITGLDVSLNTLLIDLNFQNNQVSSINLLPCILLEDLNCSDNMLSSLNLSSNPLLNDLNCEVNQLAGLDLTTNPLLIEVSCNDNQLSNLNLSFQPLLTFIDCEQNSLTSLSIKNGNNHNLSSFDATGNPALTCIEVDTINYMNTNWGGAKDITASYSTNCPACTVNIPNANFKAKLLANAQINTNSNSEIECSEAAAYSGSIVVPFSNISNLTGIASFTAIDTLVCDNNNLSTLNLSANTALVYIQCSSNQLSSLNMSGLASLKTLYCYLNQLTSLDVSTNTSLQILNVAINQLSGLYLSTNTSLKNLGCANNQLTSLDVANNTLLTNLKCSNNSITSFNVYNNPLISFLSCSFNQISFLDVSGLTVLDDFDASDNDLYYLNIQNGNNLNFSDFEVTNNPNLTCVQVDDVAFMTTNYLSAIDATASYSLSCAACTLSIPDSNFKAALVSNPLINTNANTEIECSEAVSYTGSIYVPSYNISNLSGIEYFTGITALDCFDNQLTSLDVSANAALTSLICTQNQISNLNLTNASLQIILCNFNMLSNLNLAGTPALNELLCDNNQLTAIDVSTNTALTHLYASNNQISSLNLSNNLGLRALGFLNNLVSTINLSINSQLTSLDCYGNSLLTELNIQNGNDSNLTFFATNNCPLLTCIQVDDTAYMNANWNFGKDSIATFSNNCTCILPASAGLINGLTAVSACSNQNGITYSINPIANASNYNWILPPLAAFIGNADSNVVTIDYSPYSSSGNITVAGINGCGTGISSSLAINFKPIPVVEICKVTIDSLTQKAILYWQKPTETYVVGYVIYREIAGVYVTIDTVPNTVFSSFLDTSSQPNLQAEKYKIAVLDSCGNIGDSSAPFEHETIHLYGSVYFGGVAKLYWNDYIGITDTARYFRVMRDNSGSGPFQQIDSVPKTQLGYTDIASSGYPNCRYLIEMVFESNCNPSAKTMATKSTSRSNIKYKTALFDSLFYNPGTQLPELNQSAFKIYPNPAKELVNVVLKSATTKYEVILYDVLGKEVLKSESSNYKNESVVQLPLKGISEGLYFVKIKTSENEFLFKLKVQ